MPPSNRCYFTTSLVAQLLLTFAFTADAGSGPVALHKDELGRAGITIAELHALSLTPSVPAIGAVLDPGPVIQISGRIATVDAQVAGAKAKVVLEIQQQAQAATLYQRHVLALAEYQKAEQDLASSQSALAVDQAKRAALLAQTETEWGTTMAAALRTNGDPLPQLAAGKTVLVGLSLPPGVTLATPPPAAEAKAAGARFALRLIGPVPTMIGAYPGQGFLYEADAQAGVPIGTIVSATLPNGPERSGVLVPSAAVTWQSGHSIAFRVGPDNRVEPVAVATDTPAEGGYFVTATLSPGDRVVVHGAALLLGAGTGSDADEDGD